MPGIIGERFFAVLEQGKKYIDLKAFVKGFFRVYYSSLEDKMKFTFDIYDFNSDG